MQFVFDTDVPKRASSSVFFIRVCQGARQGWRCVITSNVCIWINNRLTASQLVLVITLSNYDKCHLQYVNVFTLTLSHAEVKISSERYLIQERTSSART